MADSKPDSEPLTRQLVIEPSPGTTARSPGAVSVVGDTIWSHCEVVVQPKFVSGVVDRFCRPTVTVTADTPPGHASSPQSNTATSSATGARLGRESILRPYTRGAPRAQAGLPAGGSAARRPALIASGAKRSPRQGPGLLSLRTKSNTLESRCGHCAIARDQHARQVCWPLDPAKVNRPLCPCRLAGDQHGIEAPDLPVAPHEQSSRQASPELRAEALAALRRCRF